MSEFNYFPINTENEYFQIPIDDTSKNKQFTLKPSTFRIFTYAAVTVIGLSLPIITQSDMLKTKVNNTFMLSNQSNKHLDINNNNESSSHIEPVKTIDLNKLILQNEIKEMEMVQSEIKEPIIKFESFVVKLGLILALLFSILSLPFFIGLPSLLGLLMSLGLPVFVKLRKWERGE